MFFLINLIFFKSDICLKNQVYILHIGLQAKIKTWSVLTMSMCWQIRKLFIIFVQKHTNWWVVSERIKNSIISLRNELEWIIMFNIIMHAIVSKLIVRAILGKNNNWLKKLIIK